MNFTIKDEFKNLLPENSEKNFKALEEDILKEGVKRPILIWKEQNILIDGHTRLSICQKHNITYEIEYKSFASEDHVTAWIIQNQFDNELNRKLTAEERKYLIGKKYAVEKKINGGQKGNQNAVKDNEKRLPQNEEVVLTNTNPSSKFKSTSKRIAVEEGISRSTVERAEKFANAVDILESIVPKIKTEILSGQIKIPRHEINNIALIAQSEPKLAQEQYEEFKMKKNKQHEKKSKITQQKNESNITKLASKQTQIETIAEDIEDTKNRKIKFVCPICNWIEDEKYIFTGIPYKHPQSFMKELKDAKPATEALHISHSSISRMQAIMPDDPDRILAYQEVITWCQSAIEDAKQYQLKMKRRR